MPLTETNRQVFFLELFTNFPRQGVVFHPQNPQPTQYASDTSRLLPEERGYIGVLDTPLHRWGVRTQDDGESVSQIPPLWGKIFAQIGQVSDGQENPESRYLDSGEGFGPSPLMNLSTASDHACTKFYALVRMLKAASDVKRMPSNSGRMRRDILWRDMLSLFGRSRIIASIMLKRAWHLIWFRWCWSRTTSDKASSMVMISSEGVLRPKSPPTMSKISSISERI